MPRTPTRLPDHLGTSFSVRSALTAGVSARRLRHPDLAAPFRGVRVRRVDTPQGRDETFSDESPRAVEARRLAAQIIEHARAFAAIAPDDWFFCRVTAAVLWGLPVPLRLLRSAMRPVSRRGARVSARGIDAAVLAPRRASRAKGVRGFQLSPLQVSVRTLDGLRVTSPATTWALLADELTIDELIEIGDAIVRIPRRRGMLRGTEADALGSIAQLSAAADVPYRRHAGKLKEAVAQVRVGSSSPAETRTRLACMRAGLPDPNLDYDVIAGDGNPIGFTEFAYPEFNLLIEYEGDHHRTDRDQWQRDVDKHAACVDEGWEVLRLTSKHLYPSTTPAVDRIRTALIRGGWCP
jgi:hypothetical protein